MLFLLLAPALLTGSEGKTIELGKNLAITEIQEGVYLIVDWIPFGAAAFRVIAC